jgi:uncharacterized protein (TIGR02466 family)
MNNDHVEVVPIFPIPVYFAICEDDIKQSIDYMENAPIDLEKDQDILKEYGTISSDDYILNRPEMTSLREWIMNHVDNYARNVLAWDFNKIDLTMSWVSIKEKGQRHKYHIHPNSLISGVFYWDTDDIEPISFLRPRKFTNFEIERNENIDAPYAFDHHNFTPRKNTLVLFPSETQHSVGKIKQDLPRKSLAFNTFIFEKIGRPDSLTELDLSKPNN